MHDDNVLINYKIFVSVVFVALTLRLEK